MSDDYELEKWVWDDGDFDVMGWHDATIHAIALGPDEFELSFDIDYIFMWAGPAEGEEWFHFRVAPCTLVFQGTYEIRLEVDSYGGRALQIQDLRRSDPRRPNNAEFTGRDVEWRWVLECHSGEVSFWSAGFKQYVRRAPVLTQTQFLTLAERGGYSFDRRSPDAT